MPSAASVQDEHAHLGAQVLDPRRKAGDARDEVRQQFLHDVFHGITR